MLATMTADDAWDRSTDHRAQDEHDTQLEQRVRAALDTLGVDHEVIPCDPDLADTAAFCAHYGYGLDESANCIVVVGKATPRTYVACLAMASTRLDVNGLIRARLGVKRTSFASAAETVDATNGMRIGGVTPFGLPAGMRVWIDADVLQKPRVIVGGGSRRCKVIVPPSALRAIPGAEIVDDLAKPAEPPAG
jgi:prolyl-tRNA editing enzyme YbaK/EbsC (Cys-tRNA(Pro) deacylase)